MTADATSKQAIFFESERLWFRPQEAGDLSDFTALLNHPEIRRTIGRHFPSSVGQETRGFDARSQSRSGRPSAILLSFGLKGEEQAIGTGYLFGFDWQVRAAEWGIGIAPEYWNRGYGREVAARMLRYCFEVLELNRVHLGTDSANLAGHKAYLAAGFVLEARERQATWANGRYEDMLVMSVLREEWIARNHAGRKPASEPIRLKTSLSCNIQPSRNT